MTFLCSDAQLSVEWYRKAAEQGDLLAQNVLGESYAQGLGLDQNDELVIEWFRKTGRC
ncbi:MAG: hypothetical protein AB2993_01455 [Candidatus Symbiodolus clandestinus]